MYKFYSKSKAQLPLCAIQAIQQFLKSGLLMTFLLCATTVFAQLQQITLKETNAPLKKVFQDLKKRTGFEFLASSAVLDLSQPVTISVTDQPISVVLETIFKTQPLKYEIRDKIIVVTKKEVTQTTPRKDQTTTAIFKGKVIDTIGNPLPGATIKNLSSNLNVTTSSNGEFEIEGSPGDEILVTFVGYISYHFQLKDSQGYISILLKSGASQLNEVSVVSTGYQTIPKERVTGSFSQPIKAAYEARVAPDVLSKLNGITSGLLFNANTTASKSGTDINIRGRSTIFANDQPLIVVDNFPYNGNINNINPNDVENITILKDAAAASIWGVRAGNGVIVITTKRGQLNQDLKINFNANITLFDKPDLNYNPNQLDASSYIGLERFLFNQGYYNSTLNNSTTGPAISPAVQLLATNRAGSLSNNALNSQLDALQAHNVNEQLSKYFYQNAANQQYSLNLSGGSNKAVYFFSTGYDRGIPSITKNSNDRITINSQNIFYPIKNLEITANLNIVQNRANSDNTLAAIQGRIFPYSQFADANGNHLAIPYQYSQPFIQNEISKGFLDWSYVPLNELGAAENLTKVTDVRISTGLKYTFFKGLNIDLKYQYENGNSQNKIFQNQETYYVRNLINQFSIVSGGKVTGYNVPLGGILNTSNSNNIANNLRGTLNYDHIWGDNEITALAGYELTQTNGDSHNSIFYGYNDNLATFTNINPVTSFATNPNGSGVIPGGLGITSTLGRLRSSFGNAAYVYKDRYTLSGSARIDGSNYFGVSTNQKSVPLWSAGAKWDISKEKFYSFQWLPTLSIRASYGYNGNLISSITGVTTFRYYSNSPYTNFNYAQISNLGNPDLRWEKNQITNLAVDFAARNNIIYGSVDFFFKKGTDLLGFKSFPENTGITSLEGNYSGMTGHGFDINLNSHILTGIVKWNITALISHATDKVTHYDVTPLSNQLVSAGGSTVPNVGRPVYAYYGYKWNGLDPTNGNPIGSLNGNPSQNYALITTATPLGELSYIGPARPTYFGGLYNSFFYKGFTLAVSINYKLGYYFMAPTINYSQIGSGGNAFLKVNRDYNQRWQKPGDEKFTNIPSLMYPFSIARDQFYQYSNVNIHKADNIRLQDVSLSYDFKKSVFHKLPFKTLQVYAYANNLAILWKANHLGLDPDAIPGPGDNTITPAVKSIAVGIKGGF